MGASPRKLLWIVVGLAVLAGAVRVGAAVVSKDAGCQAGRDPAPKEAPPFPEGPTERRGVWLINADGSGETRVPTGQPGGWPSLAAVDLSFDGRKIVYADSSSHSLMVTNVDGGEFVNIGVPAAEPSWSRDGTKVAFVSNGIDVINADGSGRRTVVPVDSNAHARDPAWSPDGMRIAYSGWWGRDAIRVASTDGTDQRTVTALDHFRLSHPSWSPDGSKIAFAAGGGYYGTWLGIVNFDGSGLRRIASHCGGSNPAWSPDGTRIAYEDKYGINIINADGSHRRRVPNSWYGHDPAWSADGDRIAFFRY